MESQGGFQRWEPFLILVVPKGTWDEATLCGAYQRAFRSPFGNLRGRLSTWRKEKKLTPAGVFCWHARCRSRGAMLPDRMDRIVRLRRTACTHARRAGRTAAVRLNDYPVLPKGALCPNNEHMPRRVQERAESPCCARWHILCPHHTVRLIIPLSAGIPLKNNIKKEGSQLWEPPWDSKGHHCPLVAP